MSKVNFLENYQIRTACRSQKLSAHVIMNELLLSNGLSRPSTYFIKILFFWFGYNFIYNLYPRTCQSRSQ